MYVPTLYRSLVQCSICNSARSPMLVCVYSELSVSLSNRYSPIHIQPHRRNHISNVKWNVILLLRQNFRQTPMLASACQFNKSTCQIRFFLGKFCANDVIELTWHDRHKWAYFVSGWHPDQCNVPQQSTFSLWKLGLLQLEFWTQTRTKTRIVCCYIQQSF